MSFPGHRRGARPALADLLRRFVPVLLASALAAGCEYPFQPFQESENAVFSIFGYLDLKADTQWVRVMPIRQNLLLEPEPIDAVVTLEHAGSGRTVTLRDSLFRFPDPQLGSVAYAYNFWTAEPLEAGAIYRLSAERADGTSTTATVVMPPDLDITFLTGPGIGSNNALLYLRAEHLLLVEVFHAMSDTAGDRSHTIVIREGQIFPTDEPGKQGIAVRSDSLELAGLEDVRRLEIRVAVGAADWPFHPELPDLAVSLPGTMPSNVENGLGFVGGVATWTIPFHHCAGVIAKPDGEPYCRTTFSAQSASIEGTLVREPCGGPAALTKILLTESFADGTAVTRRWKSGWDGAYRFEGIEPGAGLTLQVDGVASAMPLPTLGPAERYTLQDIGVPQTC